MPKAESDPTGPASVPVLSEKSLSAAVRFEGGTAGCFVFWKVHAHKAPLRLKGETADNLNMNPELSQYAQSA